jgi:O-antigen/teichoic acid export membrane protein
MGIHLDPIRGPRRRRIPGRAVLDNITARLVAVVALGLGTILVARVGGAEDVGLLALLRVVPGLVGVLAACGLPGAMGYFLAGPHATEARLWPTILALLAGGIGLGMAAWFVLLPALHAILFKDTSTLVMVLAGVSVGTQLPLAVAKSSLQGLDDRRGSNVVTAAEEAAFLPAFGIAYLLGLRGPVLLVVVLIVADVVVAGAGWARLVRQVHGRGMRMTGRPDRELARSIVSFGLLGQVGGLVNLLNLRLDFLVLGSIAGPAQLGVYAVASKFAELVKLPALAVTWVSYPRIASLGPEESAKVVRRQLPWLGGLGIVGAVVLALAAGPLLPALYGQEFVASVVPAAIIAVGLVASPAGGLASGYLLGTRRPGTNSVLQAVGLIATLGLDLLLIPWLGVIGAAVASAVAYLVTDLSTVFVVRRLTAGVS